jgi:hypothetical protein
MHEEEGSQGSDCEVGSSTGGNAMEVDGFALTLDSCSADGGQRSVAEVQV